MGRKFDSILLIDDKVAENRYNQIILQRMKIIDRVEIAVNGEEALKILEDASPDASILIVLDLNMPRMNGWEFLEEYEKMDADKKK
jgi:CheY-like chemotaxis protein